MVQLLAQVVGQRSQLCVQLLRQAVGLAQRWSDVYVAHEPQLVP